MATHSHPLLSPMVYLFSILVKLYSIVPMYNQIKRNNMLTSKTRPDMIWLKII